MGKSKGERQNQKGICRNNTSNTDIHKCKNCGRTGHWVKDCCRPGGGADHNNIINNRYTQKDNSKKDKGKGKGKQVDVGGNGSVFRHSLNRVVSFTHPRSELSRAIQR